MKLSFEPRMPKKTTLCALLGLLSLTGWVEAAEPAPKPKLKGTIKQSTPKLDLGMPVFEGTPKDTNLQKVADKPLTDTPTASSDTPYTVVSVVNTKSLMRSAQGVKPTSPMAVIMARGAPLMTEKFTSVIKVKGAGKRGTIIEVKITDPRGDVAMSAEGQLVFRAEELDWTVDWEPAFVRTAGDFQMNVRVGSQPVASFPIKVEAKKE